MEVALSYNWNVYKIFKNGHRAKAPIMTFECDEFTAEQHFNDTIKKNFTGKFANANYQLVRADLPQHKNLISEEEKFSKEKNRVLGRLVAAKKISHKYNMSTSLVFCRESGWNWQWAAVESGTSKYIKGLSPEFDTYEEADSWIRSLISKKQT
tara:strand:+ start:638 stop:1096 length:459 start_codon:yes stop_codon:yes gene_type:complete